MYCVVVAVVVVADAAIENLLVCYDIVSGRFHVDAYSRGASRAWLRFPRPPAHVRRHSRRHATPKD